MSKAKGKGRGSRLVKRIEDWKEIKGTAVDSNTVSVSGFHYHKPGSQNPRK